jgi:hypothetical protein
MKWNKQMKWNKVNETWVCKDENVMMIIVRYFNTPKSAICCRKM